MYKKDQFKKLASGVTLMASAPTLASFALPGGSGSADLYKDLNIPSEYSGINWSKVLKVLGYSVLAAVGISAVIYLAAALLWKKEDNVSLKKFEDNHEADNIEENEEERGGKNGNEDNVQEEEKGELTVEGLVKKVWDKYGELKKKQENTKTKYLEIGKECDRIKGEYKKLKEKEDTLTKERAEEIEHEKDVLKFIEDSIFQIDNGYLNIAEEMLAKAEKCKKYLELQKTSSSAGSEIIKYKDTYLLEIQQRRFDCESELDTLKEKYGQDKGIIRKGERRMNLNEKLTPEEQANYEKAKKDINEKYSKLGNEAKEKYEKKLSELQKKFDNAKTEFEKFKKDNFEELTFEGTVDEIIEFKGEGFLTVDYWLSFNGMKSDGAKEFFEASKDIENLSDENNESRIINGVVCACEKFVEGYKKAKKEDLVKEQGDKINLLKEQNIQKGKNKEENLELLNLKYSGKCKQHAVLGQRFQELTASVTELKVALESEIEFRCYINRTYGENSKAVELVNETTEDKFDQVKIELGVNFDN